MGLKPGRCSGTGKAPLNRRVTGRDLGAKFGGKMVGDCPHCGGYILVTTTGLVKAHDRKDV